MRSVLSLLSCALLLTATHGNKYDEDTGAECKEKAEKDYCLKDPQTYFDCPSTCALHLRPKSFTFGAFEYIDGPFFKFKLKELGSDKVVNFDDFDGEITIVSLIPLHPGMAQFHYDLLDHVLDVYKYVVNAVVIPMPGTDGVSITPKEGSKIHILDGGPDNELVVYFKNKISKMNSNRYDGTQLNSFVVSYDARHISMHVYPDMKEYRKFIEDQMEQMENEL